MPTRVKLDLTNLRRFRRELRGGRSAEVRKGIEEWGQLYAKFTRSRFDKFSRGSGNWRRLRLATVISKQRAGARYPGRILVRSGELYQALRPTTQGFQGVNTDKIRFGMRIDIRSIRGAYQDGTSIADVVMYHNDGGGRLPKRRIFVNPDSATKKRMGEAMRKQLARYYRRTRKR